MPEDEGSFLKRRYWHKDTKREYLVIEDTKGICTLQRIDYHCIEVTRTILITCDTWERLP